MKKNKNALHLSRSILFVVFVALVIGITFYAYEHLPKLYYSNDEWKTLGAILTYGFFAMFKQVSLIQLMLGAIRPLSTLVNTAFFVYFPLNVVPFAIVGYVFHILNGILVYRLVKRLTGSNFISFVSGIFFCSASIYVQVFSWIGNTVQVPTSTFFMLLSLFLFFRYREKKRIWYFVLSLGFLYISFLFKETSIFLVPLYFAIDVRHRFRLKKITPLLPLYGGLIIGLIIYLVLRIPSTWHLIQGEVHPLLFVLRFLWNILYYPFIGLTQAIVPVRVILRIAYAVGRVIFGDNFSYAIAPDVYYGNITGEIFCMIFSSLFLFFIWISYRYNKKYREVIRFFLWYYVSSFVLIAFYLVQRGSFFIESRYFYIPVIGVAFFVGMILDTIRRYGNVLLKIPKGLITVIILLCFGFYSYKQITMTRLDMLYSVHQAEDMKKIVKELLTLQPTLPDKPIFYITGDTDFYIYKPHRVPFQLGIGFILMLLYYKTDLIPKEFITESFLMLLGSQGYREQSGKAFGYFGDKEALIQEFQNNRLLSVNQIVGFYYDSMKREISVITPQIQQEVNASIHTVY